MLNKHKFKFGIKINQVFKLKCKSNQMYRNNVYSPNYSVLEMYFYSYNLKYIMVFIRGINMSDYI